MRLGVRSKADLRRQIKNREGGLLHRIYPAYGMMPSEGSSEVLTAVSQSLHSMPIGCGRTKIPSALPAAEGGEGRGTAACTNQPRVGWGAPMARVMAPGGQAGFPTCHAACGHMQHMAGSISLMTAHPRAPPTDRAIVTVAEKPCAGGQTQQTPPCLHSTSVDGPPWNTTLEVTAQPLQVVAGPDLVPGRVGYGRCGGAEASCGG